MAINPPLDKPSETIAAECTGWFFNNLNIAQCQEYTQVGLPLLDCYDNNTNVCFCKLNDTQYIITDDAYIFDLIQATSGNRHTKFIKKRLSELADAFGVSMDGNEFVMTCLRWELPSALFCMAQFICVASHLLISGTAEQMNFPY